MTENIEIVRRFIQAWSGMNPDVLADYFTEDGVYHNMPAQPVTGRDAIRNFIATFLATWQETAWDVPNIAGAGDVVFAERVDRIRTTQGNVDLPCVGVFELTNGKIRVWRDYFDMTTYLKAMQPDGTRS